MSKMLWRYVEVTYELPDKDTPAERIQFFATVGQSESPNVALLTALEMCARRHPEAINIEEFMQRVITHDRATAIRMQMDAGTWNGWDFKTDHIST